MSDVEKGRRWVKREIGNWKGFRERGGMEGNNREDYIRL